MKPVLAVLDFLSGKKTYIVAAISAADGVAHLVDGGHWSQIIPYLIAGGLGTTVRLAIAKVEAKIDAIAPTAAPIVDDVITNVEDAGAPTVDPAVDAPVAPAAPAVVQIPVVDASETPQAPVQQ